MLSLGGCSVFRDSPSVSQTLAPANSPSAVPSSSLDPADLARWTAFRKTYGLPSDLAWIAKVASDPEATHDFDVPLLPAEVDVVARRNRAVQDLMPAVIAYGTRFPDYGGARIEGTKAIILFRDGLDEHQQTLDRLFGSGRIDVRAVPYSIADLRAKGTTIMAERDWLRSIGVELVDADPDELTNTVRLRYIAPDRSAEPAILDHFGNPDWLTLRWLGPPPWTGPWGRLLVTVVDPAGRPLPTTAATTCSAEPIDTSVRYTALPTGTDGSDHCLFDHVPAVAWDVAVTYTDAHSDRKTVHRRVDVPVDGTGSVTVVIDD